MREKAILKSLAGFPFLINLKMSFMDKANLYFVFEHCMYGTLSNLITKQGRLSEELCRIYASELVLGLKYLHEANVMHRDLKPENVLIEENLHLKIVSPFLIEKFCRLTLVTLNNLGRKMFTTLRLQVDSQAGSARLKKRIVSSQKNQFRKKTHLWALHYMYRLKCSLTVDPYLLRIYGL